MDQALKERVLESSQVDRDRDESVDAVIVGTGCGGSVVAKALAQAGKSVLMLERGGFFLMDRGDFDQREDDMMARIDGGRGLDATSNGQIALTYGHNVGGASVHYWADTWRTPDDRLELWARMGVEGHSPEELRPFFEQIERDLNVHPAEDERMNRMNRLFDAGAAKAGMRTERVLQARKGCVGSGYCAQGCAYDAKQSQLVTNIPAALAAGARLYADCRVERVLMEGGRAVGVAGQFIDRRTNQPSGKRLRVRAKVVVVAAGGFSSAPLLMRSGVPDPSGQLGKNLRLNPCAQTFALFDEDVVMWRYIPAATGVLDFRLPRFDEERYVEGGYLLHPNQLQPATLSALLPGFGKAHRALMARAHQIGSCISWVDDAESGEVTLDDDGEPVWHWELRGRDEAATRDAMKKQATVLLHAGAREVIIPDPAGTRISDLSELRKIDAVDMRPGSMLFPGPHPAGMARMGKDPRTSVVGSNNEVHTVKGLFVCDPSVFPTAVSVDPSETIMAFSAIAAKRMLERWPA
ncbi:MAG TPA: GMC family oxidoreductase [Myxococcales bacterium]|nr:GMC family oxidoreductase [Myxococcales bacterium]